MIKEYIVVQCSCGFIQTLPVTDYEKATFNCQKCKKKTKILDARTGGSLLNVKGMGQKWSGLYAADQNKKWKELIFNEL